MVEVQFLVDCADKKSCKLIREDMTSMGFKISPNKKVLGGDHIGIKKFKTIKIAENEARKIMKKYDKKIHQIVLG